MEGKLIIRRASKADIEAFSPMPHKPTLLAWVGEIDGRLIGLGGLRRLQDGRWLAFLDLTDEARPYKMHIMRQALRMLAKAKEVGVKYVYAQPDPCEEKAKYWLARLGFAPDSRTPSVWRWGA
jgi:N-acetylglutamate synthase-like GNAT family acetyltransferase